MRGRWLDTCGAAHVNDTFKSVLQRMYFMVSSLWDSNIVFKPATSVSIFIVVWVKWQSCALENRQTHTHAQTATVRRSHWLQLWTHQKIQTISMSSVLVSRSFFSCSAFWRQEIFLKFEVTDSVQGESFNWARLQVNSNKQVNSIRGGALSAHSTIKSNVFLPPWRGKKTRVDVNVCIL